MTADEFNEKHPIGTKFQFAGEEVQTTTEARMMVCFLTQPPFLAVGVRGEYLSGFTQMVAVTALKPAEIQKSPTTQAGFDEKYKDCPPTEPVNLTREQLESAIVGVVIAQKSITLLKYTGYDSKYRALLDAEVKLRAAWRSMELRKV